MASKNTVLQRFMTITTSYAHLTDRELVDETKRLALHENRATAALIRSLIEFDARRLYLAENCSSLFKYCTEVLHLSEDAAYNRMEVARAARRFPAVLDALADGSLTLTSARRLAPHLTAENCTDVLSAAKFKSKSAIEDLIAKLSPQPDVKATIRKLPQRANHSPAPPKGPADDSSPEQPKPAPTSTPVALPEPAPAQLATTQTPTSISTGAQVQSLAPERFRIQFTIGQETREKLKVVQDLLRHSIRNGDLAEIFDRAITLLLRDARRQRFADTERPRTGRELRPGSRHVPAAIQRFVWKRDEGRCTFVGPNGRCSETSLLQFHHEDPFAMGGPPTAENLCLRCAAHNRYEAELFFAVNYPGIVRETRPDWPASEFTSRNENRLIDVSVVAKAPRPQGHQARPYDSLALGAVRNFLSLRDESSNT
jgi:hypothetical protein